MSIVSTQRREGMAGPDPPIPTYIVGGIGPIDKEGPANIRNRITASPNA